MARPKIPVGMAAQLYDIKDDCLKYIHWEEGYYNPNPYQAASFETYYIQNQEGVNTGYYGEVYACCAELEALGVERIIPLKDDK